MTTACITRPRPRPRLVTDNTAPAAPAPPPRPPLISSEAQRTEAAGARFYPRVNLKPKELPSMYLALSAFPRRRAARSIISAWCWAVLPNLIGTALFLLVVGMVVGAVRS